MTVRFLAAAALAFALAAAPASAAVLDPLKPCYVSTGPATEQLEDVVVSGEGFAPESVVEVLVDGVPFGYPPTGSVGEFSLMVDAPYRRRGERPFTVEARDGSASATVRSRVTSLRVTMKPRRAAPSRRVRFRGRGFMLDGPVFAHYAFADKVRRTVRLARRTKGACGKFRVRRRQIPIKDARTGRWTVQIDQKRTYAPEPDPVWVRLPINVVEVFLEP